jgi:hypothetical protein
MDFLDERFATIEPAQYQDFLGLGNNKQKATAENAYEQDLLNRFPFTTDCEEQKKMVAAMYKESAETLNLRNSAKKNSNYRNDLTGKLRAFDKYIPEAVNFLNTVACAGGGATQTAGTGTTGGSATNGSGGDVKAPDATVPVDTKDTVLDTTLIPSTNNNAAAAGASGGIKNMLDSLGNNKKYVWFGLGLVAVVGGVLLIKHIRK